jgi:hypothetical protein
MSPEIEILPSHKIDKQKWDDAINSSTSPLIYATSIYQDHLADNWHGIVIENYETVMPIAWRKKYGIRYAYDVPFIQQLGWFSKNAITNASPLIRSLLSFCKYGDYNFNYDNKVGLTNMTDRKNYVIDLSRPYTEIVSNYKTDLTNNLKKAQKEEFIYANEKVDTAIEIYTSLYREKIPRTTETDLINFRRLCTELFKSNRAFAKKVMSGSGELLAVALLLKDEKRLYNIMNSTTEAGRKAEANHFLLNNILQEFAGRNLIFDFEGSDIRGVKIFYEKFGAVNQRYYKMHFNQFPFPLNLLKR